ncbi:MAG: DNA lyase [Crenarchaeota archaeon]|nr:DNA lyase [Thermoproteota archaeon]
MIIRVEKYSLKYTLYPSFTLTLFDNPKNNLYVKVCGYSRGLKIEQKTDNLVLENVIDEEYIYDITGLWYDPNTYVRDVDKKLRDLIERIIERTSFIRISVSRQDYIFIFISTYLSRNTDYYTNVIRWVKKICQLSNSNIRNITPELVKSIGRSYQLQQLAEVLDQALSIKLEDDFWNLRRTLLKIKYAGPKVVDAFLIFTKSTTSIAPSDIHYERFIKTFGIFENFEKPIKNYCIRYTCESCPRSSRCLTGLSYRHLGKLSSWLQTVSYVIDREFCNRRLCHKCPLKDICIRAAPLSSPL